MPLLLLAVIALALFAASSSPATSPAPVVTEAAPPDATTHAAIAAALARETDPKALLTFSSALLPDYPVEAGLLQARALSLAHLGSVHIRTGGAG